MIPKNLSWKTVRGIILAIIVLIGIGTSTYTVEPEEVGIVLRFGAFEREVQPGLNFIAPFGVETMLKVPKLRQLKQEFGFRTVEAGVNSQFRTSGEMKEEALMITGDLAAAQVEWIVQYSINDAYNFLFKVKDVENTFRYINEAVLREVVGDRSVNEVITTGRQEITFEAKNKIQALCDQYETGIKVDQLILQDVNPPDPVKPAFNEVNEAEQEKDKLINQAQSEYNKVIPSARGEALRIIEEAKGYSEKRINEAKGDAQRFTDLYREYSRARDVTRQRIYLETMAEVLKKVDRKFISDGEATGILPMFDLKNAVKGGN
ncbi:MAG: FtsH protease activity modulator HflK [Calditrichaeota bacterium]|nr:FtsH protease activity modulator HflK [Calditrichota bacterium]